MQKRRPLLPTLLTKGTFRGQLRVFNPGKVIGILWSPSSVFVLFFSIVRLLPSVIFLTLLRSLLSFGMTLRWAGTSWTIKTALNAKRMESFYWNSITAGCISIRRFVAFSHLSYLLGESWASIITIIVADCSTLIIDVSSRERMSTAENTETPIHWCLIWNSWTRRSRIST